MQMRADMNEGIGGYTIKTLPFWDINKQSISTTPLTSEKTGGFYFN